MKVLVVMPTTVKTNLYAIRLDDLFTAAELKVAQARFKTITALMEFVVDFCDCTYIFGEDGLKAVDVELGKEPKVFDTIVNASRRLRGLIGLDDTLQIDSYKIQRKMAWITVRYEVPTHERTGHL